MIREWSSSTASLRSGRRRWFPAHRCTSGRSKSSMIWNRSSARSKVVCCLARTWPADSNWTISCTGPKSCITTQSPNSTGVWQINTRPTLTSVPQSRACPEHSNNWFTTTNCTSASACHTKSSTRSTHSLTLISSSPNLSPEIIREDTRPFSLILSTSFKAKSEAAPNSFPSKWL